MKRILLILAILTLVSGCGAPQVTDGWVNRADRGILNAEETTHELFDRIRDKNENERTTGLDKLLRGLKSAYAAKKLTDKQFVDFQSRLIKWLATTDATRATTNVDEARALGNLAEIRTCLDRIREVSRAFGTKEDVNRRLDRIEDLVRTAIKARGAK